MTDTVEDPGSEEGGAPLDAAESMRIIAAQRAAVERGLSPDGRLMFGVWGVAWLVGYLTMYFSADEDHQPAAWGGITFGLLLFGAIALTAVHIGRRSAGVRGASARIGAMYGAAWTICFIVGFTLMGVIVRPLSDVEGGGEIIAIAANGISCLIVAALYMAGGAVWGEPRMFALGAWIGIVTALAALVGLPYLHLVMALAGGGGFLLAAVVEHLRSYRGARAERPAPAGS